MLQHTGRSLLKSTLGIRTVASDVKPLAWDTFRKEASDLREHLERVVKESTGSLDRAVAESLVDEIVNLRRANPRRRDELLPTSELQDTNEALEETGFITDRTDKDALEEHYECLLILASSCNDSALSLILYDEILQRKVKLTSLMLNSVLKLCVSSGDASKAKFIFESNESSDALDAMTLNYAMEAYTALGDKHNMTRIYHKLGEMVTSNSVIRGDLVRRIISSYLLGLVQIGYPTTATKVYEMIHSQNPDIVRLPAVQMAMIEAYSDLRNHAATCKAFSLLLESNVRIPNSTVARAIIGYLSLSNDTTSQQNGKIVKGVKATKNEDLLKYQTKAKDIYSILEKDPQMAAIWPWDRLVKLSQSREGLPRTTPLSEDTALLSLVKEQPTKQNYENAITNYALSGDFVIVEKLLKEHAERFKDAALAPKTNSALFHGSTRLGSSKYVQRFESLNEDSNIPPSLARSLLNFYIAKGNILKACDIMYKILERYPSTITAETCESLLKLFVGAPRFLQQRAADLLSQLTDRFPDSILTINFFNTAMTIFTHSENAKAISEVLEQIKHRSLVPDAGTYTALMELYLRKPDYKLVVATYTQMIEQKLAPNTGGLMALIVAMGESKALAETKTVLFIQEQLQRYDIEPTEDFVQVLRKATASAGNPAAFGILLRAITRKHGLSLTPSNYVSWLAALLQCDQITRALELTAVVLKESREDPDLLTIAFCESLALYIAKEAGDDLDSDSVNRWINHRSVGSKALSAAERVLFEKDIRLWNSLFPEDLPAAYSSRR